MSRSTNKILVARAMLLLSNLLFASLAMADGLPEGEQNSRWAAGIFAGYTRSAYKDFDNKVQALPVVTYQNDYVRIVGPSADLKLGHTGAWAFELTAQYSGEGYQSSDSSYFRGMDTRDASLWLGGRVKWKSDVLNLSAELLGDASGFSKGEQFKLGVDKSFQLAGVRLEPRLFINWQDEKYLDYYYGVKASEVRADRALYKGEAGYSTEVGLRMSHMLAPGHSVFIDLSATALPSAIRSSPLVDRSSETSARLGYLYAF